MGLAGARGRGVGEALIQALIAWAQREGYERLILDVGEHNSHAIALYARLGFEPTGQVSVLPAPHDHVREHERVLWL